MEYEVARLFLKVHNNSMKDYRNKVLNTHMDMGMDIRMDTNIHIRIHTYSGPE